MDFLFNLQMSRVITAWIESTSPSQKQQICKSIADMELLKMVGNIEVTSAILIHKRREDEEGNEGRNKIVIGVSQEGEKGRIFYKLTLMLLELIFCCLLTNEFFYLFSLDFGVDKYRKYGKC